MAEHILNTRIILKYDTLANWTSSTFIPKAGEVCIATVPVGDTTGASQQLPAVLMKVGDGVHTFSELNWLHAKSADIYEWARSATKPEYQANEIKGLADYISGEIQDTNTQYNIAKVSKYQYKLQKKELNEEAWADTGVVIDLPNDEAAIKTNADAITALQGLVGETSVGAQIAKAIADLKLSETYDAKGAAATAKTEAVAEAKTYTDGLNTTMDGRVATLEAKFGEGEGTVESQISAAVAAEAKLREDADTAIDTRIDGVNTKIAALEDDSHTHANKEELDKIALGDKALWDAEKGANAAISAMKEGATITTFKGLEEEIGKKQVAGDYATKAEAQGYADAKDEAIAAAKKAGDDAMAEAQKRVASVSAGDSSVTVGGTATAPTVAAKLSQDADNALELATDGLKVVIPAAAEYSIVKDEAAGDFAAVYHLTKGGVNVGAAINIPKDMVVQSGEVVTNPTGQPAGTYIKLVLQNVEEPLYINVGNLIEYVTSGSAAGDMVVVAVSDDHKVTATITDGSITLAKLHTDVQTAIGKAHVHDNKEVLDGITATNITDWNDAVAKEHEHANKELLDTYTQTEANLADAVAKKHEHANKAELDKIVEGDKAKWDAAEGNAKAYADGLAKNYDASGSAAQALTDAKAYTDEKIGGLDKDDTAVAHQFVTAVSEADGIITVSRAALAKEDIPTIEQSQVNGLGTALNAKANDADLKAIAKTGNVNDLVQTEGDVLVFDCGSATKNI